MHMRPSRLFFALLGLLLLSNGAWLYGSLQQSDQVTARESMLMENNRTLAQFVQLANASLSGRGLKEVEPALQKIFPGIPTQITKEPRTYVIGQVVLRLDEKDNITGVATLAP